MFSPTRASKRRLHEIDDRIASLSKVIDTIKGVDRAYFNNRLLGVRLKQQKVIALSAFAEHQRMQIILAEIDVLVAEHDLNVDIEAITNSKKFKSTEKILSVERESEDLDATIIIEEISSHSTPIKIGKIQSVTKELTPQKNPQNSSRSKNVTNEVTRGHFECFEEGIKTPNTETDKPLIERKRILKKNKTQSTQSKNLKKPEGNTPSLQLSKEPESNSGIHYKSSRTNKHKIIDNKLITITEKTKETQKNVTANGYKKNQDDDFNLFKIYKKIYSPGNVTPVDRVATPVNLSPVSMSSEKSSTDTISSRDGLKKTNNTGVSSVMANKLNIYEESITKGEIYKKSKACSTRTAKSSTKPEDLGTKRVRKPKRNITEPKKRELLQNSRSEKAMEEKSKLIDGILKDDEEAIGYMNKLVTMCCATDLSKRAQHTERNAQTTSQELAKDLFKDLIPSNRIKTEKSSSKNTTNCSQCGTVTEGHMCAFTIREILENC